MSWAKEGSGSLVAGGTHAPDQFHSGIRGPENCTLPHLTAILQSTLRSKLQAPKRHYTSLALYPLTKMSQNFASLAHAFSTIPQKPSLGNWAPVVRACLGGEGQILSHRIPSMPCPSVCLTSKYFSLPSAQSLQVGGLRQINAQRNLLLWYLQPDVYPSLDWVNTWFTSPVRMTPNSHTCTEAKTSLVAKIVNSHVLEFLLREMTSNLGEINIPK